jgi:hypothetical protein
MNNSADENPVLRERFAEVFSRLPEQDIEQFYAQYQLWLLRRRVPIIQKQIEALDEHLAENQQVIQSLQPSAVALAVLARLQSNGVSNIELLDQMLERGEDWLDRMMQRLDYCEQVKDFIQGDYTQWCYRSLEGAYDWIDTLLGSVKEDEEPRQPVEEDGAATEELLLQKLRLDDEEEMLEATLKQPAVKDEDESKEPAALDQEEVPLGVAEEFPMAGSGGEGQSEEVAELEQPPELANWEDLEAPEGRPVPWYSVNLAADASTASTQPEEMNEWIKVLQEENTSGAEAATPEAAVDSLGVQDVSEVSTEQAESGGTSAGEEEVLESEERSGAGATGGEDEQAQGVEEVLSATEPSLAPEETLDEQLPGEMEEAGEVLPASSEIVESEEVAPSIQPHDEHGSEEDVQPLDESEAASEIVEPVSAVDEAPGNAEKETSAGEVARIVQGDDTEAELAEPQEVESDEASQDESAEGQEIGVDQEFEVEEESKAAEVIVGGEALANGELPGEREMVSAQTQATGDALPEEASDDEIAGTEEQRPWYEYLDLEAPVAQEQSRVEERVEPEEAAPLEMAESMANPEIREYVGENGSGESLAESAFQETVEREPESDAGEQAVLEDDATQPMALRDIQRAQAKLAATAYTASDTAENVQSAAREMVPTEASEVGMSVETEREEVRETIRFTVQEEAGRSEAPDQGQEIREPVSPPAQQAPPQPQSEEPPKKRGFWRRLFGWLWGN